MGVPKFYRWISERYPCLSEVVKEHQVPEFDNLYLDMNGIIHNCSHPQDDDPHFRITEEQIFKDIFNYIEVLFRIIRPRRTFFMAVDGVAPRAKMNQQRGRRFRSAKEAENTIKQALQKGEVLPTEKRFDSNCITPGTHFMEKLQSQLEYFVQTKITNDRNWQGVKVYLSGHQTPGEGEHKIMEFIRYERTQPHYDPNTRHCLYGLDADLMMLGLCTHEPHFALLREEVKFTRRKNSKTQAAAETTFHLLHISLMREYIDHEFSVLKTNLPFEYDIESIIDDWVLMGFLVGNDFIPHLPDLHISTSALPFLYQTYMEVLPQLDGYLNEGGTINLQRMQVYLQAISKFDLDHFEEIYSDYKWLESKSKAKKRPPKEVQLEEKSLKIVQDLAESQGMVQPGDFEEDESTFDQEFKLHKQAYYQSKFDIKATEEEISNIAYEYILGIQWICHYYYNGVQSWGWFYPYHYSPYMSDLCNLSTMQLNYEMNQPFLPFQQLLAVLPAASKDCIPEQYWGLMEESSIIGDFYPRNFSTDLNGKQQEWEAVVLIPFIDENRSCTHSVIHTHVIHTHSYQSITSSLLTYEVMVCGWGLGSTAIENQKEDVPTGSWLLEDYNNFTKGLLSGCKLSVYYQGFPTLYHLPHKSYLKKQGVKVFQAPSRNENMILRILPPTNGDFLETIGERLLGQSVYVNWPHMEEAKVISVSDGKDKISISQLTYNEHVTSTQGSKIKLVRKSLEKTEISSFIADQKNLRDSYLDRRGINIGDTRVVIYAQVLLGKKYVCGKKGEVTLEKQWSTSVQPFPVQTVLKDIDVKDQTFKPMTSIAEMLPKNAEVFNIGVPHYGCMGKVGDLVCSTHGGNATITFQVPDEPNLARILKKKHTLSSYHPGWKIASNTGVSGYILSRITGSVYAYYPETRKWSIGLNLKFTKERSGVAGFTKRKDNEWLYSDAVTGLILGYRESNQCCTNTNKQPVMHKHKYATSVAQTQISNKCCTNTNKQPVMHKHKYATSVAQTQISNQCCTSTNKQQVNSIPSHAQFLFSVEKLQELTKWLKSLPSYGGTKVHESSNTIEPIVVSAIDEEIKLFKVFSKMVNKCIEMNIKLNLKISFKTSKKAGKSKDVTVSVLSRYLYCPQVQQGTLIPDKSATHQEMDRIVNVREGHTVPLGLRGTVIGIHTRGNTEQEMIFDVLFDDEFMGGMTLGGRCPSRKGYTLPVYAVINLSHGDRMLSKNNRPVAVVHPHHQGAQVSGCKFNNKIQSKNRSNRYPVL
uniref:5'-3' exoribonuclease 1 n=2 Tax=Chordata TaxID=7711 RepID=H2ZAS5_CIOSA